MDVDLAVMLGRELSRLGPELMSKHMKAQMAGNEEHAKLAAAQMVIYIKLLERYQEDDEYYQFIIDLQQFREGQEEFYLDCRAQDDRKLALIALSRLRFLGVLQRRLTAGERTKAIEILHATPSIVRH